MVVVVVVAVAVVQQLMLVLVLVLVLAVMVLVWLCRQRRRSGRHGPPPRRWPNLLRRCPRPRARAHSDHDSHATRAPYWINALNFACRKTGVLRHGRAMPGAR